MLNSFTKMLFRVIITVILFLFLSAFKSNPIKDEKQSNRRLRVGVSLLTLAHPFFSELLEGLQDSARAKGYKLDIVGAEYQISKQLEQLDEFIIENVDAIIVNPCHKTMIGSAIQNANLNGIPVFTVDTDCVIDSMIAKVECHIGTDNFTGGKLAAEAIIDGINGEGKIIMLIQSEMTSSDRRVQGFKERIEKETKITIVKEIHTDATREAATKHMRSVLNEYHDLRGVFAINDEVALGAYYAIQEAHKNDIILVGFDGSDYAKKLITTGTVFYDSIIQEPRRMGNRVIEAISEYFDHKPLDRTIYFCAKRFRKSLH